MRFTLLSAAGFAPIAAQAPSCKEFAARYENHHRRIQEMLPAYSGVPPLLDLSKGLNEAASEGAGRRWEDRFTGSMGVRPISDPGFQSIDELTSISTTITEVALPQGLLPAKTCDLILIGRTDHPPTAHLSYNRRFVYSLYDIEMLRVLKGKSKGETSTRY